MEKDPATILNTVPVGENWIWIQSDATLAAIARYLERIGSEASTPNPLMPINRHPFPKNKN